MFFRLRQAEEEVERLQVELADSEENADELEEEVETLMESRAKMRVEIHEAHCQVSVWALFGECPVPIATPSRTEPSQASMPCCTSWDYFSSKIAK